MSTSTASYLRIGAIANRTGVSAKALRLYEQRGLLKPCTHSPAGYRLYGPVALQRLMQIVLLKRSGFTLAQIGRLLSHDAGAAAVLLDERIASLQREVTDRTQALESLRAVAQRMDRASHLTLDQLLETLTMSNKIESTMSPDERNALHRRADTMGAYFTDEEREGFRQRAEALGEAGMSAAQHEWPQLIAQVRSAMTAGTPATDASIAPLAQRWHALVNASTGGDPQVALKLREAYLKEPQVMAEQGMDPAMFGYVREAMQAAGLSL